MNKLFVFLSVIFLSACTSQHKTEGFKVNGVLENAPDQKVYLEQLFFNQNAPQVLDTVDMVNGKFTIKVASNEEGLYRIRFEKNAGYLMVNDNDDINFSANAGDSTLVSARFNTPCQCIAHQPHFKTGFHPH